MKLQKTIDAEFLRQTLNLGMFVPTDESGNALKEPSLYYEWNRDEPEEWIFTMYDEIKSCVEYYEAKKRVLFKGFELKQGEGINSETYYLHREGEEVAWAKIMSGILFWLHPNGLNITLEYLTDIKTPLELTESAIKRFTLK